MKYNVRQIENGSYAVWKNRTQYFISSVGSKEFAEIDARTRSAAWHLAQAESLLQDLRQHADPAGLADGEAIAGVKDLGRDAQAILDVVDRILEDSDGDYDPADPHAYLC